MHNLKFLLFLFLFFLSNIGFPITLTEIKENAREKNNIQEVIKVFEDSLPLVKSIEERANLLEEIAELYSRDSQPKQAAATYQKIYIENKRDIYLLYAARCLLEDGNNDEADLLLEKIIRSKDKKIRINAKLYKIWSSLIEISKPEEINPVIEKLHSYLDEEEMKEKRASIFFILWYITKEEKYRNSLKKEYPSSVETAISLSLSKASLPPSPFWLFMPQKEKKTEIAKNKKRRQLGLFKNEKNALSFISDLKHKGFDAYVIEEIRKSGATYFIVVVDEKPNKKIENALRKAGYESYPLE